MLEKEIQAKILKYLRTSFSKAIVWKLDEQTLNGIPDILFIHDGHVIFFEVKNEKGRVKKIQRYTLNKLEENHVPAFVVRSVDEVRYALRKCFY